MTVDGYRPFLLSPVPGAEVDEDGPIVEPDWTAELELDTVKAISKASDEPLKVLVLYGSLRDRYAEYSRSYTIQYVHPHIYIYGYRLD